MKRIANRILSKSTLLSMFVIILGLSSCDPVYDLPVEPELNANAEFLVFGLEGGVKNIKVTTNRAWTAKLLDNMLSDSVEWCSISSAEGNSGDNTLTITVAALDGDYREATLLLNCSAAGAVIPIMQSGIPIVTVMDATNIDESNATLTGNWMYSGDIEVTELGFALAPAASGEYTNTILAVDSITQGTFSQSFTDLASATNYLYKFYVKASSGEYYYSASKSFTTDVAPVLIAVKDLVTRGKGLSVGGSQEQAESEFINVSVSNVVETASKITLSLVDLECNTASGAGTSVADYGIRASINADSTLLGLYQVGDVLKIRTKGALLSNVGGNPLLGIKDAGTILVSSKGYVLNPVTVTHIELNNYLAMYVAVANTQVTKSYLDAVAYPSWSTTQFTMEVEGSRESYLMQVPAGSSFAADPVLTGSGVLKGIVAPGLIGYLVNPRSAADLAGLANDRFTSLLELLFLDPVFNGELLVNQPSTSYISIPYSNGDGSTLTAEISVTMTGASADTLTVASLVNPTIAVGLGELVLNITGIPTTEGDITFTIEGFDAFITNKTVMATITKPDLPEVGNFEVVWDVSTCNYATQMPFTTNTNPSITVTDLVGVNFNGSSTTTKYTQDFATTGCDVNTEDNKVSAPGVYLTTSLTVAAGKILHLSGLDITCRTNGGDSQVSFQYSLDGSNFTEFEYLLIGSIDPTTLDLRKVDALKNVVEGATVTFRIVPVNPISTAKWGVSGKSTSRGMAFYGDVVDK